MEQKQKGTESRVDGEQEEANRVGEDSVHSSSSDLEVAFEVLKYPNPTLTQISKKVTKAEVSEDNFRKYLEALRNTLNKEHGVGIAAPQVGWMKRIIIVENDIFYNPVLKDLEGEQWVLEACLSVDLPAVNVKRAEEGTLIARDENWEEIQAHVFGFDCAVFQHEIDHLDGLLYTDRIPRLELDLLKRKVAKAKRHLRKYGTANPLL